MTGIKYATFKFWFKLKEEAVPGLENPNHISGLEIVLPNGKRIYSEERLTVDPTVSHR